MLDWHVESGTVVDGTGAPPSAAAVGIRDGLVSAERLVRFGTR